MSVNKPSSMQELNNAKIIRQTSFSQEGYIERWLRVMSQEGEVNTEGSKEEVGTCQQPPTFTH